MTRTPSIESRIFRLGGCLVAVGALGTALIFGVRSGASFLAGGLLSAANLAMLRHTVNAALLRGPGRSGFGVAASYLLRLVLIPLCLYAMMRLLSFGIIAATAGFAVFSCGIFLEGILEAFKSSS